MPIGYRTSLPVASIRGLKGQLIPRNEKSENLVIIKCVDSVYFIVDFVLQWILCNRDRY